MRRFLFILSAWLIAIGTWSQVAIGIQTLPEESYNSEAILNLSINNQVAVKSFQCDIQLPNSVTFLHSAPTLNSQFNDYDVAYKRIDDHTMRLLVSSNSNGIITPDSVAILNLGVSVIEPEFPNSEKAIISDVKAVLGGYKALEIADDTLDLFNKSSYYLKYSVDGVMLDSFLIQSGDSIIVPETPIKEGYTFSGWQGLPEVMPAHEVLVTGTFTVNKYKLTGIVELDGKVIFTKSDSVVYGTEIPLPEVPELPGYTFSGWSDVPATMPAHDLTITASFIVNYYKLTYKVDGKEYFADSVAYKTTLTPIEAPTKEGHTFSGWNYLPETMPAKDVEINGTFSVNSYLVSYVVDGVVYHTDSVAYGSAIVVPNAPVKEGSTFSGWSNVPETMPAQDLTITASFIVNYYKLTYKVDGKEYFADSVAHKTTLTPIEAPTKEGHTFSGWNDLPETMPAKDVEVNGTFSVNSYLVSYVVDGAVYHTDSVAYGFAINAPDAPIKDGYTFRHWENLPETMPSRDIVTNAIYTINEIFEATNGIVYKVHEGTSETGEVIYNYIVYTYTNNLQADIDLPAAINDIPVISIGDNAFYGATNLKSIVIPNNIISVGNSAFESCDNLLLVKWDTEFKVLAECFGNPEEHGNMLVLANNPGTFEGNVVVNREIDELHLIDGKPFRNPYSFIAKNVSYTREFKKETRIGQSAGWESLVLPFDVETISHEHKGEIRSFTDNESTVPHACWMATLQDDGLFGYIEQIKANTPFIMSVPNSLEYDSEYNLGGNIIFSATNAVIHATTTLSEDTDHKFEFKPCYEGDENHSNLYTINDEVYVDINGEEYLAGAVFANEHRDIRPFESYIHFTNGTTNNVLTIRVAYPTGIASSLVDSNDEAWYTIQGVRLEGEPQQKGIYIHKGKKVFVR